MFKSKRRIPIWLITRLSACFYILFTSSFVNAQLARDYGIEIGILETGKYNAITDVHGVRVGHVTLSKGDSVRTGVTAIVPAENVFMNKIPAGFFAGNGFGKFAGSTQIMELGNLETPIVLTNTMSVGTAFNAVVKYTINLPGNEEVRSVNAVVGETNDSYLNDIRGLHVREGDVIKAINDAKGGVVQQGNVGAGTGTSCFGFKGGIGTSSRVLPASLGGYTVGVLVQSNFGGVLTIDGVPVGEELGTYMYSKALESADGSCMIIVATDAPIDSRNLE
ncbi:MAG: P1 family peptidase, partial [Cyclobacteriaceae bacterium]|nr:P1 family peptidase [Cyclobacteriaceae bacterium]